MIVKRHEFSVDDYVEMIASGILDESDRVELIRGEIIEKMNIGIAHSSCVTRLVRMLYRCLSENEATILSQSPVRLPRSMPEPDVVLARPSADGYAKIEPTPAEILLLVEVADSSLDYDRTEKLPDYAESGIREYWIVNLPDRRLEIYAGPRPNGGYPPPRIVTAGNVSPAAFANVSLAVSEILL